MIRNFGASLCTIVFLLALSRLAPAQQPELYKHAPDWKVEVVAEAPRLLYPTAISVAPDGRIFVGEDTIDMGGPADQPIDRVVCVHPDGRITVFATNLGCVFGLQYLDGKLFVNHAPKCSVFTDRDSVGVDRQDLFDYTNPRQLLVGAITHIPGNIRWGMDGYLYMAVGDTGVYNTVGRDGKKISMQGGGILRFRPDGTELEIFALGTRNHPDVALNAEDEMFTYDNTDDGQGWWTRVAHMVDGGNYGYPWEYRPQQPYILWMMGDYGAGSGTASFAWNEDGLPPEYEGNLFLGDYARSQLMRLRVERDGGTYKIVSREMRNNADFLASGTSDFRPLGVAAGLDGSSLYVTDWNSYMCWVQGVKAGRLLKLTYQGKSRAVPRPNWLAAAGTGKSFSASPADLITGLKHPAQSVRLIAQRRLSAGGIKNAPVLIELLADKTALAAARWGAIWALDGIDQGQAGRKAIVAALQDSDPSIKRQAARQLGTRRVSDATPALIPLLKDTAASVRFHAATALGRIGAVESVGPLIEGLVENDSFARYATFTALNRIGHAKPEAWPKIVAGLSSTNNAVREGILFAMRETYSAPLAPSLSNFVFNSANSLDLRLKLMAMLGEIARKPPEWNGDWWGAVGGVHPVNRPRPAKTRDWEGTPAASATLRQGLKDTEPKIRTAAFAAVQKCNDVGLLAELIQNESSAEFFPAMQTLAALKAEAAIPAVAKHVNSVNAGVRQAAFNTLVSIGGDKAVDVLSSQAIQPASSARLDAIGALGRLRHPAAVPALLSAFRDVTCRSAALHALVEIPDVRAIDVYAEGLRSPDTDERERCLRAVATIQTEALPLLEKKMEQNAFPPQVVERLRQLPGGTSLAGWYVIGPAKPENVEKLLTASEIPVNAPFVDATGRSFSWQRVSDKPLTGRTDVSALVDDSRDTSASYVYAAIALSVGGNMDVQLRAEAEDPLVLWWNGTKVLDHIGGAKPPASVQVKIAAGRNRVLARLGKTSAKFGSFSVRLFPVAAPVTSRAFDPSRAITPKAWHLSWTLNNAGNPESGRNLFKTGGCVSCHRIHGEGESIGPDLSSIGSKYNREQLVDSLLYPSKQILIGYQQTVIITQDDEAQTGVIRSENDQEVVLLDSASQTHTIKKSAIKERRRSDVSLMPEDMFDRWSAQEFGDLVTYLASLKNQAANR